MPGYGTLVRTGEPPDMFDVIIVGAGPAGLSAALILGRCRRKVLVCDNGQPRNHVSKRVSGFLTRDGMPPADLRRIGREQLAAYDSVEIREVTVIHAECRDHGFEVELDDQTRLAARKLLLATGVIDDLPPVEGAEAFYGRGVHHCPYCDGWELRDQPLAIYGGGEPAKAMALELTMWSRDLAICADGPAEFSNEDKAQLTRAGIIRREERISRLEGDGGELERIRFETGEALARRALFFPSRGRQRCDVAERLGCPITEKGMIETGKFEKTPVRGVYVAGDASRNVQLVVMAAAEGATAAFAINTELVKEDFG
jgi:thioredoxin reductase